MSIDERARELCWKYGLTHAVVGDSMFKTEPTPVLSSAIAEAIREPLRELRWKIEARIERLQQMQLSPPPVTGLAELRSVLSWLSELGCPDE